MVGHCAAEQSPARSVSPALLLLRRLIRRRLVLISLFILLVDAGGGGGGAVARALFATQDGHRAPACRPSAALVRHRRVRARRADRCMYGAQLSLTVGLLWCRLADLGTALGVVSGYVRQLDGC